MAAEMTTHERVKRMCEHREADRVPVTDEPWGATVERWRREGLPAGADYRDYFGLDKFVGIGTDNSPRYPIRKIEETEEYTIATTPWGVTQKNWRHAGGVPEFLDFTIINADTWAAARKRMTPDRDRVKWDWLKREYPRWRESGAWIRGGLWFGFDVTHSFIVGTERVLMNMATDPEWIVDMFNHELDVSLALLEMVWDAGYTFDAIGWYEDMGYKGTQFFGLDMYRELVKPVQKRACDWAKAKGIKVWLHSCGDIRPFVPELVEIGVDMLNPLEVKAGMDPFRLKKDYGDKLVFHGGLNAALFDRPEKLFAEMREVIPAMKVSGGYIASSDHSVPQSVSLETFREFVRLARELGRYG
jgi:uroporphyrinogen decarboxylase